MQVKEVLGVAAEVMRLKRLKEFLESAARPTVVAAVDDNLTDDEEIATLGAAAADAVELKAAAILMKIKFVRFFESCGY